MIGNEHDPIFDRFASILNDARPGPGDHLAPDEIEAFAVMDGEPGGAVPGHLRECPLCWNRVFEAKREQLRSNLGARRRKLIVGIEILKGAVRLLEPPPGLQAACAFGSGETPTVLASLRASPLLNRWVFSKPTRNAGSGEQQLWLFDRAAAEPTPVRHPEAASGPDRPSVSRYTEPLQSPADQTDSLAETIVRSTQAVYPAGVPARDVQSVAQETRANVSIALPVDGADCVLAVTWRGEHCDLDLSARLLERLQPASGALLTLRRGDEVYRATADEWGTALLQNVPIGKYDFSFELPSPKAAPSTRKQR